VPHEEDEHRIMRLAASLPTSLVLVKHAMPVQEPAVAPRHWRLGLEGEHQSRRLASRLLAYAPLRLVASPEPKALMTGQLVAAELGLNVSAAAGLEEFDRPPLPLMPKAEHERTVAPIFGDLHRLVLGAESGRDALTRFSAAVDTELAQTDAPNLVAITHGTVISLFVAAHNDIDGFALWKQLACPSFVVLDVPSFLVREIVSAV
jgi:broad specificity phosphatase PhoE